MHGFRRHLNEPLPAVTAVVLAVLVALAASISDGLGPAGESAASRVPAGLVTPGRVLVSVLSTVAERLEDDWTQGGRRIKPSAANGLGLARASASPVASIRPAPNAGLADADQRTLPLDRGELHRRRTLNLPPPAVA